MKTVPMTIRVTPDIVADIDAFARHQFPQTCAACKGQGIGAKSGETCLKCEGEGVVGVRADALRFLLQFALGAQATPEMRAMVAAYENSAPMLISLFRRVAHTTERTLKEEIKGIIRSGFMPAPDPDPPPKKKKRRKRS